MKQQEWQCLGGLAMREIHPGLSAEPTARGGPLFGTDVHVEDGRAIVRVAGELGTATAGRLCDVLDLVLSVCDRLVFDLTYTTFMDAAGLGAIMGAGRRLGDTKDVTIRSANPAVRTLLRLTGCDQLLTVEE